ncbi:MAG: hypothetical protein LW688_13315 [Cryomorphaceae bacterium]|nr:hypothetical protein [Cryomorphaceae bacterium]
MGWNLMYLQTVSKKKNNAGIINLALPMKRVLLYSAIAIVPFLIVILVNESTKKDPYIIKMVLPGTSTAYALNSDEKNPDYCTWDCHNKWCSHRDSNEINTGRVKLLYDAIIDINGVHEKEEGKYIRMTILTLVIIWPLFLFALIVGNIELYKKRKDVRNTR